MRSSTNHSPLLINEHPLQVLPSLVMKVGMTQAIILQQLHYWIGRATVTHGGHKWVYNSIREWQEQFPFWDEKTIRNAFSSLRKEGIVLAEQLGGGFDRKLYYAIQYDVLNALIACDPEEKPGGTDSLTHSAKITESTGNQFPNELGTNSRIFTETTTETTREYIPGSTDTNAEGGVQEADPDTGRLTGKADLRSALDTVLTPEQGGFRPEELVVEPMPRVDHRAAKREREALQAELLAIYTSFCIGSNPERDSAPVWAEAKAHSQALHDLRDIGAKPDEVRSATGRLKAKYAGTPYPVTLVGVHKWWNVLCPRPMPRMASTAPTAAPAPIVDTRPINPEWDRLYWEGRAELRKVDIMSLPMGERGYYLRGDAHRDLEQKLRDQGIPEYLDEVTS